MDLGYVHHKVSFKIAIYIQKWSKTEIDTSMNEIMQYTTVDLRETITLAKHPE